MFDNQCPACDRWWKAYQLPAGLPQVYRFFHDGVCHECFFKWDRRFLEMARLVASWSKDPSTQTGAVIVDRDNRVVSVGYNGFPKGVKDNPARYADRETKYKMIVHCERNAILFARRDLSRCTLYTWPFMSCSQCAGLVIQSGIRRCVAPPIPDHLKDRWGEDMKLGRSMFEEAGVELCILPEVEGRS